MPQKTPAEGGTDGLLAPPRQGGQNFRKNVAIFSGTRIAACREEFVDRQDVVQVNRPLITTVLLNPFERPGRVLRLSVKLIPGGGRAGSSVSCLETSSSERGFPSIAVVPCTERMM